MINKYKFLWRSFKARYRDHKMEIKAMLEAIEPGDIAIDVGANKGSFSYSLALAVGEKGRLLAFEPQVSLAQYLRQMFNELSLPQCEVYEIGISDENGNSKFYIPTEGHNPSASIVGGSHIPNNWTSQEIQTASLDSFLYDETKKVACIKVDVEGNELNVIKGALKIIQKFRPLLVIECEQRHLENSTVEDTIRYITDLGYDGFFILNNELISVVNFLVREHQPTSIGDYWNSKYYCNNFIFRPKSKE
tara:strand:+ start:490 stop:1233 length:744 start_codon:yes stop_codon:yes gene_type:complete